MEKRKLKRKGIQIGNKPGIVRNSIVSDPAIGIGFNCFSTIEEKLANSKLLFKSSDAEQILAGPVLIPGIDILRKDPKTGEYFNAVFTPEDIVQLLRLRQFNKLVNSYTLEHDSNQVFGKESFIDEQFWIVKDPQNDTSNHYGFTNLPVGTLFSVVYVKDLDLYNKIKSEYNGFSIEAYFDYVDFDEKLNLKNINKMEKNIFSKLSEFLFTKQKQEKQALEMYGFKLKTGEEVIIDGDTMEVTISGAIPEDGDYELEDGTVITVSAGILIDVKQPQMQASEEETKEQEVQLSKLNDDLLQLTTQFEAVKQENEQIKLEIEQIKLSKESLEAEKAELLQQIELFKKMKRAVVQPDVVPTSTSTEKTNKFEQYVSKLEKIASNF